MNLVLLMKWTMQVKKFNTITLEFLNTDLTSMKEVPYYANYSRVRRLLHDLCNNKYFDLVIAAVIGLNVVSMSLEFYRMPKVTCFFFT